MSTQQAYIRVSARAARAVHQLLGLGPAAVSAIVQASYTEGPLFAVFLRGVCNLAQQRLAMKFHRK